MIKLRNLLNEGMYGKFYWMDPVGKLQRVMKLDADTGHREAAIQILIAISKQPEANVFHQMYDLGWLRVAIKGDRGNYMVEFNTRYEKQPTARQLDALKDLANELKDNLDNNKIEYRDIELINGSTKERYPVGLW